MSGEYPYYGATGVLDYVSGYIFNEPLVLVGEDGAKWGSGENTAFAVSGRIWVNNHAHVLRPHREKLLDEWLLYYVNHSDLTPFVSGLTVPKLNQGRLREISVPVPHLLEQQRIVGILDQAFDGIAKAKANAEQNLRNARAIFESHMDAVFSQRGSSWMASNLEDVVAPDCTLSYGIVQPGDEYADGLPVVRPTDLTSSQIGLGGLKRIDPVLAASYRRTTLRGGELLLCVRGSTGMVSVASNELVGANVTRGIVPIRIAESVMNADFAYFLLKSGEIQRQIRNKTYGAALMQINIRDLRVLKLWYPPKKEQARIATRLATLAAESKHLAGLYERKIAELEALKRSLLHDAFSGQL